MSECYATFARIIECMNPTSLSYRGRPQGHPDRSDPLINGEQPGVGTTRFELVKEWRQVQRLLAEHLRGQPGRDGVPLAGITRTLPLFTPVTDFAIGAIPLRNVPE